MDLLENSDPIIVKGVSSYLHLIDFSFLKALNFNVFNNGIIFAVSYYNAMEHFWVANKKPLTT